MSLAVCGDPVVGRLLVLLLEDSGYEASFVPSVSLDEPGALEGVRLLLLTPTPELSAKRREEALLAPLKDRQEAAGLIVLELSTPSEEKRRKESRGESWHLVPWPSRFTELERRIEVALRANSGSGADSAARTNEREDKEDDV